MRKILILSLILISVLVKAQDKHLIPQEKWSKKFYISDEFCAAKGLKPGETNDLIRVWNGETKKNGIMRVVDARWYFNSPLEAVQYLNLNIPALSESGDPIKDDIKIKEASNLHIFNEGAGNRSMNNALGIKNYMYFFLFTVKNYVAKVFISTENKIQISEAEEFAKEAAVRLNYAIKK